MRLIDADALLKDIKGRKTRTYPKGELEWTIEQQPTIEAVPVMRGKWERTNITCEDGWALYRCTNCDWHTTYYYSFSASPTYNFCPNCGAYMRGNEHIDEDTKLVIDEDGVMYRVVSREKAIKIAEKALEVVNKRIEEMRGKEQV